MIECKCEVTVRMLRENSNGTAYPAFIGENTPRVSFLVNTQARLANVKSK